MKKTILILFLFSMGLFSPLEAIASGGYTNTHTTPNLELKPISSIDNSYQTASVCFLGVGDCDPNVGHSTGDDDMDTDTGKQCQNAGFTRKTCNAVQDPVKDCGHDTGFVTDCKCKKNLITCATPKFGVGPACDGKYASCQCPATVALSQANDRCTQNCDGKCIAKTCTGSDNEPSCRYGTYTCGDGCGGSRKCCSSCSPASSEPNCSHGTYTCGDGCGGYRECCSAAPAPAPTPPPSTSGGGSGGGGGHSSDECKDTYVIGTSEGGWCDCEGPCQGQGPKYVWCQREKRCTTYGGQTKSISFGYYKAKGPYADEVACQKAKGTGKNCDGGTIHR